MKSIIKFFSITIAICMAIFFVIAISFIVVKKSEVFEKDKKITSEFIENKIQEISELATLQHHYKRVANFQDAKKIFKYLPEWRINKSIKEFMIVYEGDVKLGYDLKEIKIDINKTTKNIEIIMPEPKILSHSIDFESLKIISENGGWFNEIKFEDFKQIFIEEQRDYEKMNYFMLKKRAQEQAYRVILFYLHSFIKIAQTNEDVIKENHSISKWSVFQRWLFSEDVYVINIK